jgi:hypothetical protein
MVDAVEIADLLTPAPAAAARVARMETGITATIRAVAAPQTAGLAMQGPVALVVRVEGRAAMVRSGMPLMVQAAAAAAR